MQHLAKLVPIILLATAAAIPLHSQGEEVHELSFSTEQGEVDVRLNSNTMGFAMNELKVGESRQTVTEDGQPIIITRMENELLLDVDDQQFQVPYGQELPHETMMGTGIDSGIVILSAKPLDSAKQQNIRAALAAAGVSDEIQFHSAEMTGDEPAQRQIKVLKTIANDDAQRIEVFKRRIEVE